MSNETFRNTPNLNNMDIRNSAEINHIEIIEFEISPDNDVTHCQDELDSKNIRMLKNILELLSVCTPREEVVLKYRLGIPDREFSCNELATDISLLHRNKTLQAHTLQETATEFGLTPARVRQIESKALRKLNHSFTRSKKLKDYLE